MCFADIASLDPVAIAFLISFEKMNYQVCLFHKNGRQSFYALLDKCCEFLDQVGV